MMLSIVIFIKALYENWLFRAGTSKWSIYFRKLATKDIQGIYGTENL